MHRYVGVARLDAIDFKAQETRFFVAQSSLTDRSSAEVSYLLEAALWSLAALWELVEARYQELPGFEEWKREAIRRLSQDPSLVVLKNRRDAHTHVEPIRVVGVRKVEGPDGANLMRISADGTYTLVAAYSGPVLSASLTSQEHYFDASSPRAGLPADYEHGVYSDERFAVTGLPRGVPAQQRILQALDVLLAEAALAADHFGDAGRNT